MATISSTILLQLAAAEGVLLVSAGDLSSSDKLVTCLDRSTPS